MGDSTQPEEERVVSAVAGAADEHESESYGAMIWRQYRKSKLNSLALLVIGALVLLGVVADFLAADKPIYLSMDGETYWFPNQFETPELRIYDNQMILERLGPEDTAVLPLVPYGYNTHDLEAVLEGPSERHWLGTDASGRDVLARVIHGTRVSLAVGFLCVIVLTFIGVVFGSVGGWTVGKSLFFKGWLGQVLGATPDFVLNRTIETLVSIPPLLIIIVIFNAILPQRWEAVITMSVVIAIIRWTSVARLIRGEILKVRTLEYVDAARVLGMSPLRIVLRHVIPNAISPVLVAATFATASAILIESSLSFLGFGIPDDMASWGSVLQGVRANHEAWWLGVFPGFAVFLTVTAFNLAGEGLRDAIDPRLRQ